jgi:hypothetical protein
MNRIIIGLKILLLLALGACLALSQNAGILINADMPLYTMAAPAIPLQAALFIIAALALCIPTRPAWRPARAFTVIIAALLAGHRVLIDVSDFQFRDIYLLATVQSAPFTGGDGILVTRHWLTLSLHATDSGTTLRILAPPFSLAPAQVEALGP